MGSAPLLQDPTLGGSADLASLSGGAQGMFYQKLDDKHSSLLLTMLPG
jgi:hypothetical protein